jgi:hypothetical protein
MRSWRSDAVGKGIWCRARTAAVAAAVFTAGLTAFGAAATAGATGAGASPVLSEVSATAAPPPVASPVLGSPHYLASPSGAVWSLGAADHGSMAGTRLNGAIVGIQLTLDSHGYWLVGSDGGIFSFGDARFYGSTGAVRLNRPVIGVTATTTGKGYWLFASDGGVFSFGDARFYGSTGGVRLNQPVVGMAATASGKGYWLFAGDGGVFSFGDARFYGSTGDVHLSKPVVDMAATPDGRGYWELGSDGGLFAFGAAPFYGSLGGHNIGQTVAKVLSAPNGTGYWEVAHDGDVYPFGSATGQDVPIYALLHTSEGPGDVAMEWAMAQMGKPYQWGGNGPNSFDCSGLVMRAWQAAGVAIPRVANAQYNFGTHVAISQLLPGDLVFWADNPAQPVTIHHVAMYIGAGYMVNAPYPGQVVGIDSIGGTGFVALGTRP